MIAAFARRMITETDPRLLFKFGYNCGFKGMVDVSDQRRQHRQ